MTERDVRASHAERDLTVERLGLAFEHGRLDAEEYSARVETAYTAATRGELADLTRDLPGRLW